MPTSLEIVAALIFLCAVTHTFLTPSFYYVAEKFKKKAMNSTKKRKKYHSLFEIFYILSEVELVFGLWLLPLILYLFLSEGFSVSLSYLQRPDYSYALYMTVVVVVVGSRPIIVFAENLFEYISKLGGDNTKSWWWTILSLGPFLDILLKEPGAMTISSILLAKTCFPYIKRARFRYVTMALLFINISLGGLLFPYISRSLFLVAYTENWDFAYSFSRFGWKALLLIFLNNFLCYFIFRNDLVADEKKIAQSLKKEKRESPPLWLTIVYLFFLLLIVFSSEYTPIFLGAFFLFIGVHRATLAFHGSEKETLPLRPAILVGFFFASLLLHGVFQKWWAIHFLQNLNFFTGLLVSSLLSALIDNAVVLYFLDQIKPLPENVLYAIVFGSLSSGGLTLMANAPNLIGFNNLRFFFKRKPSFVSLFFAALPLTLLALLWFSILM